MRMMSKQRHPCAPERLSISPRTVTAVKTVKTLPRTLSYDPHYTEEERAAISAERAAKHELLMKKLKKLENKRMRLRQQILQLQQTGETENRLVNILSPVSICSSANLPSSTATPPLLADPSPPLPSSAAADRVLTPSLTPPSVLTPQGA